MAYETSYDMGLKPFSHDKYRGKWESPKDFLFACLGHAYKIDAMLVVPSVILQDMGIYGLIPYAIIMLACTVPIVFMQTFLGQFSSTGFISVFRIAPIFKGVGYVSLAINLVTLTYYSIFAAIPLFYFFHSLRPTLPWSCDNEANWVTKVGNRTTICYFIMKERAEHQKYFELPSQQFFIDHVNDPQWHDDNTVTLSFSYSWSLIACSIIIWVGTWAVLRKPMEMVGRFIRYSTITMLVALAICVLRFAFLPEAFKPMDFLDIGKINIKRNDAIIFLPLLALSGLGPGWGSILSMASYNNFKTDVSKYTCVLCLAQAGLLLLCGLAAIFIENFLVGTSVGKIRLVHTHNPWMQALVIPTALSIMELPHFWSLLFFGMMTLGAINLLIVQLFSVLTSLFDEYEQLRRVKTEVTIVVVGSLCLASIFFCCARGLNALELLCNFSILTQVLLNLMLLLVVLWIYGRERFQRDVHFMTNRTYPTWTVNMARFVSPILLFISFFMGLAFIYPEIYYFKMFVLSSFVIVLPWFMIPGYCIFKLVQTRGLLQSRFQRCCRPTDWYPVDPDDRRRYDEVFSEAEINHQLTTPGGDV